MSKRSFAFGSGFRLPAPALPLRGIAHAVKAPQVRIFQSAPSSPQKSNDGEILLPLRGIRISPAGSLPRGGITPARPLKFKSAPPDRLPLQVVGSIGIPLPLCGIGISPAGSRSPASRDPLTPAKRLKRDPSLRSGFRLRAPALPLRRTRSRPQNGSSLHLILQALPVHHREHDSPAICTSQGFWARAIAVFEDPFCRNLSPA